MFETLLKTLEEHRTDQEFSRSASDDNYVIAEICCDNVCACIDRGLLKFCDRCRADRVFAQTMSGRNNIRLSNSLDHHDGSEFFTTRQHVFV